MERATSIVQLEHIQEALAYAISHDAALIFYHHGIEEFRYFARSDDTQIRHEMVCMERNIFLNLISDVSAGESFNFNGTDLFPMDIKFNDKPCLPYMLLRERGCILDAIHTPYFFTSKQERDEAVAGLNKSMSPGTNRGTTITKDLLRTVIDGGFEEGLITEANRDRLHQIINSSDNPSDFAWGILQHNLSGNANAEMSGDEN